jgi:hypothetical protein
MTGDKPPSLFIGSSVEALDVAYALQEGLDYDAQPTVWSQGVFAPTRGTLSSLLAALPRFEFSIFIFSPDDITRLRGADHRVARDNVVFEFGLFVGKLGPDRCFYVVPRDVPDFHLPTDLLGTTALTYRADRTDGNLVAALGPACNQVRRAMRQLGAKTGSGDQAHRASIVIRSYRAAWSSAKLRNARNVLRAGVTDHHDDDWPRQREAMQTVFSFLESLSEEVISGAIDEGEAKEAFGSAIISFWPVAAIMLAPPNHADDWWDPLPKLAELYKRWKHDDPERAK